MSITRRGFVVGAAGMVLAPAVADAAITAASAKLVVKTPSGTSAFRFSPVKITAVSQPVRSWRIQLGTRDPAVQREVEALYQAFLASPGGLYSGRLLTYAKNGSLLRRFAFTHGFPAAVTLVESTPTGGVGATLVTRLLWTSRTLKPIA